jgi:hypothetical protein
MPKDFWNEFNTPLSRKGQFAFQNWVHRENAKSKRNIYRDKANYDIQGFYATRQKRVGGHGTDKFKKPSHPTFSDESIYQGIKGYKGGTWGENSFKPSLEMFNKKTHTVKGMKRYFKKYEQGVKLILPKESK